MSTSWKTIRVFISSTFKDMQAERDHLVRFVFPMLRGELLKHRIHLIDVDLRWGVTSDQDALGVCREVIDECHPRFMGLLGGRYGWVPAGQDKSITADEIHYGVLERDAAECGRAFFYFRDPKATAEIIEESQGDLREPEGSDAANKLAALKQTIADAKLPVFIYPAKWGVEQKRLTGLEAFGNRVHDDLLQSLKDDPELAAHFTTEDAAPPDEFAEEAEQMEAFIEERTQRFVIGSRHLLLDELLAFAAADGTPNIFVLTGDPGSGKSALIAKFTRDLSVLTNSSVILPTFVGASTGSTDLRRTLRRLCHELAKAANNTELLPLDIKDLITHFQKLLIEAAGGRRVILVLDALNQFDATDGAHWLNWLPEMEKLPPGVRIVASVIAPVKDEKEHQTLAILRNRKDARVEELKPLAESDTLEIIKAYLKRYSKRLGLEQIAALKEKPASNLPLYVLTAMEELRTLGTHDEITERIEKLPGEARALFAWILTERLAHDPIFSNHPGGPAALVEKFAACLGVSRHGLSPAELTALLDPGDPLGNVAALLRLLRPYLMRRGELLDFYHGQFREAAVTAHLDTIEKQRAAHQSIATCLHAFADPHRDGQCRDATPHALGELPHHQTRAEAWPDLIATLENIFFLEAKVTHGMAFDLAEDFTAAVDALPPEHAERQRLHLLDEALRRDLHFIARHANDFPQALFQSLWNSAWWYDCADAAARYVVPVGGWEETPPWENPDAAQKLCTLPERWRTEREAAYPGFAWVRALHPPFVRLGSGQLAVLRAPGSWTETSIRSVAFSPDGRRVVGGSADQTVTLWDALSGRELAVLRGGESGVSSVAFAPDSNRVLSGSFNGTIRLWDAERGRELAILHGHEYGVSSVAFSPDGRRLLSGAVDNTMRLWDALSGQELTVLRGPESGVNSVAFSPDGRQVVSGGGDNTVRLWDTQNGLEMAVLRGHENSVESVGFSPDGDRVVSGSYDNTVRLWDVPSGREMAVLRGHEEPVFGVAFSPDGRRVVSGSRDNTVRLWDARSGQEMAVLRGHENWVSSVAFSPDGRRVLSGSYDNTVRLWDAQGGRKPTILGGHESGAGDVAFSPDGRLMVGVGGDYSVRLWDARSGRELAVLRGHGSWVNCVTFSPDGRQVLSGSGDSGGEDNTVRLWDVSSGQELLVLRGHKQQVDGVAFSPDGCRVLSRSYGTVRLWEVPSGRELSILCENGYNVSSAVFSPDGRRVLCGFMNNPLRLYDTQSGQELAVMRGHKKPIKDVAFSPDGRRLLSGAADNTMRLWDAESGRKLRLFRGHDYGVESVAFSPDGQRVFSGSVRYDPTVRQWHSMTGECLEVLSGLGDVTAIAVARPRRAMVRNSETVIEAATGGPPVAWYPDAFDTIFTHPEGRGWAGRVISRLVMLRLEGG